MLARTAAVGAALAADVSISVLLIVDRSLTIRFAAGSRWARLGIEPARLAGRQLADVVPLPLHEDVLPHYDAVFAGEVRRFTSTYDAEYRTRVVPIPCDAAVAGALGSPSTTVGAAAESWRAGSYRAGSPAGRGPRLGAGLRRVRSRARAGGLPLPDRHLEVEARCLSRPSPTTGRARQRRGRSGDHAARRRWDVVRRARGRERYAAARVIDVQAIPAALARRRRTGVVTAARARRHLGRAASSHRPLPRARVFGAEDPTSSRRAHVLNGASRARPAAPRPDALHDALPASDRAL